jgi:hypothetical protein
MSPARRTHGNPTDAYEPGHSNQWAEGLVKIRIVVAGLAVLGLMAPGMDAFAQTTAPNAPRGAVSQMSPSGVYVWADGAYQSINLPSFGNFGYRAQVFPPGTIVANEKHDPRVDGSGVKGAIGYVFRDDLFPAAFGTRTRIEAGGSYVTADGKNFATNSNFNTNLLIANVQGVSPGLLAGCGGATCSTSSTLSSDYRAWDIFLSGKADFRTGPIRLTPSLTVFGGKARTRQDLAQQLGVDGGPYPTGGGGNTYSLRAALDWSDLGAKLGLDIDYDVNAWLSIGLGGTAGWSRRSAALSASDSLRFPNSITNYTSATAGSADTTPFLANAEAKVVLRPQPGVSIKGFAGLNYDGRVPGIAGGEFPDPLGFNTGAAHIKFESTTSYYAGGGLMIGFVP